MTATKSEKRKFTRVKVSIESVLLSPNEGLIPGRICDLSVSGAFINCDQKLAAGTQCRVALFLYNTQYQIRIELAARITHASKKGMGIEFIQIGRDNLGHLFHLVTQYAEDKARINQEILEHFGKIEIG